MHDCISLWFLSISAFCCLLYEFIVSSSFCHSHFIVAFCILFSFCSGMLFAFCLGVLLSFLFVHWYFFVFPTLCMIAFHCIVFPFGLGVVFSICLLLVLFWSFTLCMIAFHCGLGTLVSFGYAVGFLIPPWFILFIQCISFHLLYFVLLTQSNEWCFDAVC